jgi:hypothetical protein
LYHQATKLKKEVAMDIASGWQRWLPPDDPRLGNGAMLTRDEQGRLIESADCGTRCPGCGICCAGYRDVVTADYAGVEEYEGNLKSGREGLIRQEDGKWWYRSATCGAACPGYGGCCQPFDRHLYPKTVADAHRILLEDATAPRWAMQEALLILAHDGTTEAAETLEAFMPVAHIRLVRFAGRALDEGRYFATMPRNAEEERRMMRQKVRQAWETRAIEARSKIREDLEPRLARHTYELEIAQRLLSKAQDETARQVWQTQVDALAMLVGMIESDMAEQQQEVALCDTMVAQIEADLAAGDFNASAT